MYDSETVFERTVAVLRGSMNWTTVFGRTMEVHEKKGNLQEGWIGSVENIPGTYVKREFLL